MRWDFGDGSQTRFWTDTWVPEVGPLNLLTTRDIPPDEASLPVKQFVTSDGRWAWHLFDSELPDYVLSLIAGVKTPMQDDGMAQCFWDLSSDGCFTVSSAYALLADEVATDMTRLWEEIWRWEGAQRIRVFLWLAGRRSLLTNVERRRRHLTGIDVCSRCGEGPEDVDHVLRFCKHAREVWSCLLSAAQIQDLSRLNLQEWMLQNLLKKQRGVSGKASWACLFGLTCWKLWGARNLALFQNKHLTTASIVREVVIFANFNDQVAEQFSVRGSGLKRKQEKIISWIRPPDSFVSLNCDGAKKMDTMMAGAGCIIRDHDGVWRAGCCRNLGVCSSLQAELWALMDGLDLAWLSGFRDVIVQVDCLVALCLVQNHEGGPNAHMRIVKRIQHLLKQDWRITISHVYREGNCCADFLATYALGLGVGYHSLQGPPDGMIDLLSEDAGGVGRARLYYINH